MSAGRKEGNRGRCDGGESSRQFAFMVILFGNSFKSTIVCHLRNSRWFSRHRNLTTAINVRSGGGGGRGKSIVKWTKMKWTGACARARRQPIEINSLHYMYVETMERRQWDDLNSTKSIIRLAAAQMAREFVRWGSVMDFLVLIGSI